MTDALLCTLGALAGVVLGYVAFRLTHRDLDRLVKEDRERTKEMLDLIERATDALAARREKERAP